MAVDHSWMYDRIRRIHMDFHTLQDDDVVQIDQFDPVRYVDTLKRAHVNALVSFTKCHHGHSYYETQVGHKHSGLPQSLDMFGEILAECHRQDIRVLAYYSVEWDGAAQTAHPDWLVERLDGSRERGFWHPLDCSSPYTEEVVLPQLREVVSQYDIDGLWLDIVYPLASKSKWRQLAYKATYHRPFPPEKEEISRFAHVAHRAFIEKVKGLIESLKPGLPFSYNHTTRAPRSEPLTDYLIVETHPGRSNDSESWQHSWTEALLIYKAHQALGKPWESCSDRFLHRWGSWDVQTTANMLVTTMRIAAHGGVVNMGDQAYPSGRLDQEIYTSIGECFGLVERVEAAITGSASLPYIALLSTTVISDDMAGRAPLLGAAKALSNTHWHFDVLAPAHLDRLEAYKAVILPDAGPLDGEVEDALRAYVASGGILIATGSTSIDGATMSLADILGLTYHGASPYSMGYLGLGPRIADGLRTETPILVSAPFARIFPTTAEVLAGHVTPLIEPRPEELYYFRHPAYAPFGKDSGYAGITLNHFGAGTAIYSAAPLFRDYWVENAWPNKQIAHNLMSLAIADRPFFLEAPQCVELNVATKGDEIAFHLINYQVHAETNQIEEIVPVFDLRLGVSMDLVEFITAMRYPENDSPILEMHDDHVVVKIPQLDAYTQVVFRRRQPKSPRS
ncbi:MAG: alpha-L-fucosidase [Anaerolineae bacterium]|nr:alpha-L-fucosidase [Anaerolineae bacterium]